MKGEQRLEAVMATHCVGGAHLLPGSLGLNQGWTHFKAQRRIAGGQPVNFYRTRTKRALNADYTATQAHLSRDYRQDTLGDLKGPAVKSDVTLTAYAKTKSVGPRKARRIMLQLGFLQPEIETRMVPMFVDPRHTRPVYRTIPRLASWAFDEGLGKRIEPRGGIPFDVLSPDGMAWLDARWPVPEVLPKGKRGRPPTGLRQEVQTLMAAGRTQAEIARILGKSVRSIYRQMQSLKQAA
ncbi:helix-turn-helix domain-containing protein [Mesorhizobium sp. 8]|uniref:helix-turn-helix transcriptional regulator n=1 Tax=Mesorhizobium sp. 8 TaxID=2584466 RepID=UPI0011225C6F|nr:helix-turn-helix domain-containing protein [Mesorhizobium sp. 8]QDB99521.1 helix-turn-helix domain-containing protein [Mesorhizobium sp. 8]